MKLSMFNFFKTIYYCYRYICVSIKYLCDSSLLASHSSHDLTSCSKAFIPLLHGRGSYPSVTLGLSRPLPVPQLPYIQQSGGSKGLSAKIMRVCDAWEVLSTELGCGPESTLINQHVCYLMPALPQLSPMHPSSS